MIFRIAKFYATIYNRDNSSPLTKNIDFRLPDMFYFLQLLACLTVATGHTFDTVYSWKQVEYKLPNDTIRNRFIASGDYVPENNIPLGLAVWNKKMFVTVPRWKNGVLATLNSFPLNDKSCKWTYTWQANPIDQVHLQFWRDF